MKRFVPFIAVAFFSLLQSCNDFLDIKPKGILIPEFYDDYVRLLNYKTLMYADEAYLNYLSDDILLGEKTLLVGQLEQAQEHQQNLYKFEKGAILSKGMTDNLWEAAYKRIYTFNVVINNVLSCPDGTLTEKKALQAQARVNRAFEYLTLVNIYGKHYDAQTSKADLGVPIITSEDINNSYTRNSVQEVYDFILKEVNESYEFVPDRSSNKFYPTKQFLNGFMAKIYLYMGDYDSAKKYAELALAAEIKLLNLTEYSINPKANGFGRIYNATTEKSFPDIFENDENIFARNGNNMVGMSRNSYVSKDLLQVYAKDLPVNAIDQRRALYLSDNSFKLYNNNYLFPGKSMWVPYYNVNSGLSSPEIYLILAESLARLDLTDEALKLVDKLRNNRIINNQPLPRTTAEDALRIVLEERRREFAFQGSIRIIDLKRLNKDDRFKKDIVHTCGTESWTLPANDDRYIIPIPPKVLSENPSIPVYNR